jgi:hypothetical protein
MSICNKQPFNCLYMHIQGEDVSKKVLHPVERLTIMSTKSSTMATNGYAGGTHAVTESELQQPLLKHPYH